MSNKVRKQDLIVGIGLIVIVGLISIGLLWYGLSDLFSKDKPVVAEPTQPQVAVIPSPTIPQSLPAPQVIVEGSENTEPQPTPPETQVEPTVQEEPTQPPPTETPVPTEVVDTTPKVTAGSDGVYVRSGPGTNYAQISALAPGGQAVITGRYGEWWQIQYSGGTGWVYGGVVTAANTGSVPQAQPPAQPTATNTPVPAATATPAPTQVTSTRGLIVNSFVIEDAPGPYNKNEQIWYSWDITNTGGEISYEGLGVYIKQKDKFKIAWTSQKRVPDTYRSNFKIDDDGTYKIYLRICFTSSDCVDLAGPISVTIE